MEIIGLNVNEEDLTTMEYRDGQQLTGIFLDMSEVLPKSDGVQKLLLVTTDEPPRLIPFSARGNRLTDGHELKADEIPDMVTLLQVSVFAGMIKLLKLGVGKPQAV